MRLTREAEYAIRCVLFLSMKGKDVLVRRQDIAIEMDIPDQFLGKIAQQLSRAGLVKIVQGAKGGIFLNVSPENLSLLDVIEAIIGEIFLNDCILRPDSCTRSSTCSIHVVWEKARDQLRNSLKEATFAMILLENSCLNPLSKTLDRKK